MTYEAIEYTLSTYTLVAYYNKDMEPRKVSRFLCPIKAKNAILTSLLSGQHAAIVGEKLPMKEVKRIMQEFKDDYSIQLNAVTIPGTPPRVHKPTPERKPHVRQFISDEGFKYEIRKMKAKFAPGVK